MRTSLLLAALATSLLAGCGGSDDDSEAAEESPLDAVWSDVSTCLGEAGLEVADKETTPLGVDVPVRGMEVDLTAEQEGQKLTVWVFSSAEDAEENRVAITLATEDQPNKSGVSGATVYRWSYNADEGAAYVDTTMACLPG